MQAQIQGRPDASCLTMKLAAGESVRVEAGAMVMMSAGLSLSTSVRGGLSRLLTRESLFLNTYLADAAGVGLGWKHRGAKDSLRRRGSAARHRRPATYPLS